jgi:hypothetical protein
MDGLIEIQPGLDVNAFLPDLNVWIDAKQSHNRPGEWPVCELSQCWSASGYVHCGKSAPIQTARPAGPHT